MKIETLHLVLAMKPLEGTFAQNAVGNGVAGLNIDGCRVETNEKMIVNVLEEWTGFGQKVRPKYKQTENTQGRFPANVILEKKEKIKNQFPITISGKLQPNHRDGGKKSHILGAYQGRQKTKNFGGDSGSASRFFWSFDED